MFPNTYMRPSLFSRGLQMSKTINWSGILDGTQKTLGVINQAIPIVYQVKPLISNARAMFKIADAVNSPNNDIPKESVKSTNNISSSNKPIFYI